jgi:hypothetical protein
LLARYFLRSRLRTRMRRIHRTLVGMRASLVPLRLPAQRRQTFVASLLQIFHDNSACTMYGGAQWSTVIVEACVLYSHVAHQHLRHQVRIASCHRIESHASVYKLAHDGPVRVSTKGNRADSVLDYLLCTHWSHPYISW